MTPAPILVFGEGHLAQRIRGLAAARGHQVTSLAYRDVHLGDELASAVEGITRSLATVGLDTLQGAYLVDDRDERNLEVLIALLAINRSLPVVASLFNERIAPHLQAAHPHVRILNPAKLAAPTFVQALDVPIARTLRYAPAPMPPELPPADRDPIIRRLAIAFAVMLVAAVSFFHLVEGLSWLNAVYFVVVTVATVGYGDISLLASGTTTKLVGIGLIIASTVFIWMIFSLTVDNIIKRRVQLALGRKRYDERDHVILCGLGRLGYFIAEGLLARGERVLVIEREESLPAIEHLRSLGAEVYVGDARLPRVLRDVGVTRAKALYAVINNDYVNLEIGLNARSFDPTLRLVLRIFDEGMSRNVREHLDVQLTYSMTAVADEPVFAALAARP